MSPSTFRSAQSHIRQASGRYEPRAFVPETGEECFDKKVRSRRFSEWDLVLKKVSQALKDNRGKWAPNYEGPFVIKRAFSGGALVLTNMDDEELPSPVNSDVVKRYYA